MKAGDKVVAKKEFFPLKGWEFNRSKIGNTYLVESMIGKFLVRIEINRHIVTFGLHKSKRSLKKYKLPAFNEYFLTEQEVRKEKLLKLKTDEISI